MKRYGWIGLIMMLGIGWAQRNEAGNVTLQGNGPCPLNLPAGSVSCTECGGRFTAVDVGCVWIRIVTGNMGPGVSIGSGFFRIGEDQLTPSIYSPVALGFVADYSIKTVSREKTGGGVPRDVLLFQKAGILVQYRFEDGAVAAAPPYASETTMRSRLQMVDAEGWACTNCANDQIVTPEI